MTYQAEIREDGQIILPAELGKAMGLAPGDHLSVERDGDIVTLKPYSQIVRETQQRFRELVGEYKGSMVDELIADRRAEADREEAEHRAWKREAEKE